MPYEDIYNPDTSRYQGDFSSSLATAPPLSVNPTTAYYGGYMDKGDLQASTSTLREVASTLRNVLGQFTSAVSTTFNTLRNLTASQTRPQEIRQPIVQPYISPDAGRYIGSATFLESAKGALTGRPTSPYILKSDYQQLMSEDFAKRSTLLGGSVAGVATEIGAGWLGSKTLGPMIGKGMFGSLAGGIAGYMGAGYLTSHVMGRVNQGMEFDSLLKDTSSRLGINEGGALSKGFSSSTRRKMTKEFRDGGLKMGDYADIMEYGTEYGLFQGVTTPEQFTETVKSAAKQIKVLMKVLRETDVRDAIKDVATFKQWGVPQGQMVSFAMHADAVGRAVGLTSQGVMGHMAGGAQMAQQRGMLGATGARIAGSGLLAGRAIQESGVLSEDDIRRYGGVDVLGQKVSSGLADMAAMPHAQYLQMALSKKVGDGKYALDEDVHNKFMSGKMSLRDVQREADRKVRADPRMAKEIMKDPVRWRAETIMQDEAKWRSTLLRQKQQLTSAFMKAGRMSKEDAESWAVESMVVSPEDEKWFKSLDAAEPTTAKDERGAEGTKRVKEAIEAAKGKQGLSAKWQGLKHAAGTPLRWVDRQIVDYIVDPALGVKGTIARKADDFFNQTWLGLHVSDMPSAMPEGYTSPGQLSAEAESRVGKVVSETRARAGKATSREAEASVWADKIKDDLGGFGGGKLRDKGAYEHLGSYATATEAVVLGDKSKDDLKKLTEKYKLNPDDTKKAEELYDVLQELLKQKKITEEMLIENIKGVLGLYKELEKTGAGQSGMSYATQQADYPVEVVSASRPSRWQTRTDDRMNPLVAVDRPSPRDADRRRQSAEDKARRESRRAEAEEELRLATLSPKEVDSLPESLSVTRYQPDKGSHDWLYSPTDADIYGLRDTSTSPVSTRVQMPDPDEVYKRPSRWDPLAARKKRSKSEISQAPHSGTRPDEAVPEYWQLYADDKSDTLSHFDAWRSKWGVIGYDDVSHPIAKSKLTPDTMGDDLFNLSGSHIDTKEDFARKGMVEVSKGKWVSASMAPHYGKGFSSTPQSPDISTQEDSGDTSSSGAANASKALGSSHGGLAQNAEKTSKSLDKVNKGLDGFLSRLDRVLLRSTRNSNY